MKTNALMQLMILAIATVGLASCGALVDPATGGNMDEESPYSAPIEDGSEPGDTAVAANTAETAALQEEIRRVRRQNVALRTTQSESAARIEALEAEVAEERETNARYREMMETNFNLLEQSVARSLAAQNGQMPQDDPARQDGQASAAPLPVRTLPPPTPGPEGTEPMSHWDDEDSGDAAMVGAAAMAPAGAAAMQQDPQGIGAQRPGDGFDPNAGPSHQARAAGGPAMTPPESAAPAGNAQVMAPPPAPGAAQPGQGRVANTRPSALDTLGDEAPAQPAWRENAPVAVGAAAVPAAMGRREAPQPLNDPDLAPPAQPMVLAPHSEAKPLYEKGFIHYARGDYDASIRTYGEFLERFPQDSHSDNAQFWIGEGYFQQQRFDEAESAYRGVLRNYEHRSTLEGYKTPDAIYRLGQIYLSRSDTRRAAYYFDNVTRRFPDSTAGRKAQRELDALQLDTAGEQVLSVGGTDS